jgi:hypothetical protein
LLTFSPGTNLPNSKVVLEGVSKLGMTFGAYQFNLQGRLVPVPKEEYLAALYRPLPFRIEDDQGNLLSHIQAIPWQEGAAIKMTGKLPLEGFLIFLGRLALEAQIFKQPHGAISSVLPIGKAEIPMPERKPECPERFEPTCVSGGATIWRIAYHESRFEEI